MRTISIILLFAGLTAPLPAAEVKDATPVDPAQFCLESLRKLPGRYGEEQVRSACARVDVLDECRSEKGLPIYHFDVESPRKEARRILVFSLVHGDEMESGSVSRRWMERLQTIASRNSWRIVPILNPDGWQAKKRTNTHGVDINRNFPSKNWEETAVKYWDEKIKRDPRKNPGISAASEKETRCAVRHIESYKPDFIIAIHTPYGVLDFDGPPMQKPPFFYLPWANIGTFPGSLGRYMWSDQNVPVLTIELKPANMAFLENVDHMDFLQDISGKVAMKAKVSGPTKSK